MLCRVPGTPRLRLCRRNRGGSQSEYSRGHTALPDARRHRSASRRQALRGDGWVSAGHRGFRPGNRNSPPPRLHPDRRCGPRPLWRTHSCVPRRVSTRRLFRRVAAGVPRRRTGESAPHLPAREREAIVTRPLNGWGERCRPRATLVAHRVLTRFAGYSRSRNASRTIPAFWPQSKSTALVVEMGRTSSLRAKRKGALLEHTICKFADLLILVAGQSSDQVHAARRVDLLKIS